MHPRLPAVLEVKNAGLSLANAQAHAVGGPTWVVTRVTGGDGVETDPTTETHDVTMWIYQVKHQVATPNGPVWVPIDEWKFAAAAGQDIAVDDRAVSIAIPDIAFRVATVETPPGFLFGDAERIGVMPT